ncbi:MAG: Hint domain-containing protein [Planctomycetaceae bacterium]
MADEDLVCYPDDDQAVVKAVELLQTQAMEFARRLGKDSQVRQWYLAETRKFAEAVMEDVRSGRITPSSGRIAANQMRNEIMEAARLKSSDISRAAAEKMKAKGLSLQQLEQKYAQKLFKKDFSQLTKSQRNRVFLEIIESSGRARPSVTRAAARYGKAAKGLWFLTIGIAVYNVTTAENKGEAAAREVVTAGGGMLGGAAGGAAAGFICGPGAPVCVTIGVFVGGALGALGSDFAFDAAKDAKPRRQHSNPWANPSKVCCFPEGIVVATPGGTRSIESFRRGDSVYGYSFAARDIVQTEVVEVQRHAGEFQLNRIRVDGGDGIHVTDRHYFAGSDLTWRRSEDLEPGEQSFSIEQPIGVSANLRDDSAGDVFNLRVSGVNNYFVGDSGLLVRDF